MLYGGNEKHLWRKSRGANLPMKVIGEISGAHEIHELPAQTWIAQAAQSLGFNLSHTLTRYPHLLTNLF